MRSLRKLAIVCLLSLPVACFGQGGNFVRQVVAGTVSNGGTGQPIPNANVTVCQSTATGFPCSPLAPNVYSDPALTSPIANPFAADINGLFSIFLPTGSYLVQESAPVGAGFVYAESYIVFVNGTGTVSSVSLTVAPSIFTTSGNPCTGVCVLDAELNAQAGNTVFANCASGSAVPSFCGLTAAMIPGTLGSTIINGTLTVIGTSTLADLSAGNVTSTSNTTGTSIVSGNESIGGTLGVTGLSTLIGLSVPGTTSLAGGGSLGGTFTGSPTLSGNPSFTGIPTFHIIDLVPASLVGGNIQIGGLYGTAGWCLQAGSISHGLSYAPGCTIGGTPTVTLGTGAGTGPTFTAPSITDVMGQIALTTGSSPTASGPIFTVTFSQAWPTTSFCVVSDDDANTAAIVAHYYVSTANATQFVLFNTGSALSAATTYTWSYNCRGY